MNERIKELADQANSHHDNFFDLNYKELDVFLEKFAELIVKECIEICDNTTGTSYLDGWYAACKQIRKHFGVEE
jgi:hypothetical protein